MPPCLMRTSVQPSASAGENGRARYGDLDFEWRNLAGHHLDGETRPRALRADAHVLPGFPAQAVPAELRERDPARRREVPG